VRTANEQRRWSIGPNNLLGRLGALRKISLDAIKHAMEITKIKII
jgi:hypothetical protein